MISIFTVRQHAPEDGSTWGRHAFDNSLGRMLPLKVEGEVVGSATLIAAIPGERYEYMDLTWRVEELVGRPRLRDSLTGNRPKFDEFIPDLAFNPEAAREKLRRAGMLPATVGPFGTEGPR